MRASCGQALSGEVVFESWPSVVARCLDWVLVELVGAKGGINHLYKDLHATTEPKPCLIGLLVDILLYEDVHTTTREHDGTQFFSLLELEPWRS